MILNKLFHKKGKKNKNTPYEHEEVQGLEAIANQENPGERKQITNISERV